MQRSSPKKGCSQQSTLLWGQRASDKDVVRMYKPHSAVAPNATVARPSSYAQALTNLQQKAPLMRK